MDSDNNRITKIKGFLDDILRPIQQGVQESAKTNNQQIIQNNNIEEISRRNFLGTSGKVLGGISAATALSSCGSLYPLDPDGKPIGQDTIDYIKKIDDNILYIFPALTTGINNIIEIPVRGLLTNPLRVATKDIPVIKYVGCIDDLAKTTFDATIGGKEGDTSYGKILSVHDIWSSDVKWSDKWLIGFFTAPYNRVKEIEKIKGEDYSSLRVGVETLYRLGVKFIPAAAGGSGGGSSSGGNGGGTQPPPPPY